MYGSPRQHIRKSGAYKGEDMTTKDLSRELCEICGIEAKQFTKDFKTREKAASFGRKITGIPKYRGNKFDIGSYTDNQSIYQVHWKEFPDFTQPENFVKLFELRFTTKRGDIFTVVEALQNARCFIFADRKSFLEQLLDYIFTCENFGEYIKQAIKSEVWKYE